MSHDGKSAEKARFYISRTRSGRSIILAAEKWIWVSSSCIVLGTIFDTHARQKSVLENALAWCFVTLRENIFSFHFPVLFLRVDVPHSGWL